MAPCATPVASRGPKARAAFFGYFEFIHGTLKVGARLFRQSAKSEAVREFRACLERLPETAEDEVALRLVLDPGELERGDYELSIDVVKEDQFLLAEKGATPRLIPVVIA